MKGLRNRKILQSISLQNLSSPGVSPGAWSMGHCQPTLSPFVPSRIRMVFTFLSSYILNDYKSTCIMYLIFLLASQRRKYLLSSPLSKNVNPCSIQPTHDTTNFHSHTGILAEIILYGNSTMPWTQPFYIPPRHTRILHFPDLLAATQQSLSQWYVWQPSLSLFPCLLGNWALKSNEGCPLNAKIFRILQHKQENKFFLC